MCDLVRCCEGMVREFECDPGFCFYAGARTPSSGAHGTMGGGRAAGQEEGVPLAGAVQVGGMVLRHGTAGELAASVLWRACGGLNCEG